MMAGLGKKTKNLSVLDCKTNKNITSRVLVIGLADGIGGVESFFHNYYTKMDPDKYHFDFITVCGDIAFSADYKKNNSNIYVLPHFLKHPIKYSRCLRKIVRENKYDIIHINMLSAANILPVKVALKEKTRKIIVHSHNADVPAGNLRKILHSINKRYLKDCRLTRVACGEKAGQWLFGKNMDFVIVNNAVDLGRFKFNSANRKEIREKYKIKDGEFLIGNIGRLCEQKNQAFLIDVLNLLDNKYKLMLVGQGDKLKMIRKKISKYALGDRIIIVDGTKEAEKYYSAFDIFAFPSLFEGMPVAPVEAQANGLKCLISNLVTDEIELDKVTFLPLDSILWKNTIEDNNSSSRRTYLSKFDNFNISKQVKHLENVYSNEQKEDIKVSIIIPTYNSENYVKRSIKSTLDQSYSNIETIVVDDGSTDNTVKIVEEFLSDPRIRLICQNNFGANAARGVGVKNVSGEYCLFLDSDDWLERDAITKLVKYINIFKPDIIKYNATIEPGCKKYISYDLKGLDCRILGNNEFMDILLCTPLLHEMAFNVYRTRILKNNRKVFEKKLSFGEDFYVNLSVVPQIKKYLFVDDALYVYNKDNANSTSSTTEAGILKRNLHDAVIVNERLYQELQYFTKDDKRYRVGTIQIIQNLMWPLYKFSHYNVGDVASMMINKVLDLWYVKEICEYYRDSRILEYLPAVFRGRSPFHSLTILAILKRNRRSILKNMQLYTRLHLRRK